MKAWASIFLQSPVNDGYYDEDDLPHLSWEWPKETWFQTRLDYVREREPVLSRRIARRLARLAICSESAAHLN
ncbi:MAG TPA: hypothetical protein VIE89_30755 [Candidatus Binatia bacterium]